jgi:radical SAM protein with 4Fe4S-binding SPASM domain
MLDKIQQQLEQEHKQTRHRHAAETSALRQRADALEGRLQKCRGCKQVYYCGRDCQALDWDLHKPLCKRVQRERQAAAAT